MVTRSSLISSWPECGLGFCASLILVVTVRWASPIHSPLLIFCSSVLPDPFTLTNWQQWNPCPGNSRCIFYFIITNCLKLSIPGTSYYISCRWFQRNWYLLSSACWLHQQALCVTVWLHLQPSDTFLASSYSRSSRLSDIYLLLL